MPVKTKRQKGTFQTITFNLSPNVRHEMLGGRDHLVVPMVMLTEGVHAGSGGALLYEEKDLSSYPQVWNHKPVVVYHPKDNSGGISACDPSVINTQGIGVILNTKWDSKAKKLRAEAWLDVERIDAVDPRVGEAVTNGTMMEVSTGLYTDNELVEGTWNDEPYKAIARNYKPDHLAILPDQIGACSIADGAGLLQLNEGMVYNGLSFSAIRDQLSSALSAQHGSYTYIADIYQGFCVYEKEGLTGGYQLYKQGYSVVNGSVVQLSGNPEEVVRVIEYRSLDGTVVANGSIPLASPLSNKETTMNKKELIDKIIANSNGEWEEGDREALDKMTEVKLQKLLGSYENKTVPPPAPPAQNVQTPPAPPVQNAAAAQMSPEEWWKQAPAEVRSAVQNAIAIEGREKQALISKIKTNGRNPYSDQELLAMPLADLQKLSAFAEAPPAPAPAQNTVQSFFGAAGVPPVTNNYQPPVLDQPVMNFSDN